MALTAFRKIQIGKEAAHGTLVAADAKMTGTMTMTPAIGYHRPKDENGSLALNRRSVSINQRTNLRFDGDATYQNILYFLAMALKGSVAPTALDATFAKHDDNGVVADLTNAIDGSQATSETIVGFVAADDKLYICGAAAFRGVRLRGPTAAPQFNALAGLITEVAFSTGVGTFTAGTLVEDGTVTGGASYGQAGHIEWTPPTTPVWSSQTYDGDVGFWVRLTFGADWTANVKIGVIETIALSTNHVYTPSLTSSNDQDSFSIEYGDDTQEWEVKYAQCERLELAFAMDDIMTLRADLFAHFAAKDNFTGALSDPTVEEITGNHCLVWIDGTWATLGTTPKTSLVKGGTIRFPTGLVPVRYADGTVEFSDVAENARQFEIELDMVVGTDAITEYDAYAADTLRAMRIQFIGPIIEGANTYTLTIDMLVKYTAEPELFGDSDGENVLSLSAISFTDGTNECSVTVQTDKVIV